MVAPERMVASMIATGRMTKKQGCDEQRGLPVERADFVNAQRCGEDNEDAGDQQRGDGFLETAHVGERGDAAVGQHDPHDGHGQQAGFLEHRIGRA
jgi:hypothetical protein